MPKRIPKYRSPYAKTEKERHREFKRTRKDAETNKFYSSTIWRAVRAEKLAQDPLCEECDREGHVTPATVVDHIQEIKDRRDLALDLTNLRSLCQSHHNSKTGTSSNKRRWAS